MLMRKRVYDIFEMTDPQDLLSRAFSFFIISLISLNLICIVLESIPELDLLYRNEFLAIEIVSTIIFALSTPYAYGHVLSQRLVTNPL